MMNLRKMGLGVAFLLACCVIACRPGSPQPNLEASLQSFLEAKVEAAQFQHGVALHLDSPLLDLDWEGATGFANPENQELMTPDHPVRIASNTKTYIAAAVLRLREEEGIDLDETIAEYLPEAFVSTLEGDGYDPSEITVRHLLTHTGGLYDHGDSP
ncbi:MAG: beta-lactamase family protein, partial [Thermoanaerobaculales bacterium]|nr:beta-lactamase family protein [Thermoanaerobaculales bacterium]